MTQTLNARRIDSAAIAVFLGALLVIAAGTNASARPLGPDDGPAVRPAPARDEPASGRRPTDPRPAPKPVPKPAPKPVAKPARDEPASGRRPTDPTPAPKPAPKPTPKPAPKPAAKPGPDEPALGRRPTDPKPAPKPSTKPAPEKPSDDLKPLENQAKRPVPPGPDEPASGKRPTDVGKSAGPDEPASGKRPTDPLDSRFLQFNMCGSGGSADPKKAKPLCSDPKTTKVADAVANSIDDLRPTVVTLNEVCASQAEHVMKETQNGPWPMVMSFTATATRPRMSRCENPHQFGNAVLVSHGMKDPHSPYPLPLTPSQLKGGQEPTGMVCMISAGGGVPVHVCSVHLVYSGDPDYKEDNRRQAVEVARLANSWRSQGHAVVIGGDFNATPEGLDEHAENDSTGELKKFLETFSDVDPTTAPGNPEYPPVGRGQGTQNVSIGGKIPFSAGKKIDYIFLSKDHFSDIDGGPTSSKVSDHKPLRGKATLTR
ncbi:MAG: endonuclease/exonuclease/phosphatase family protein [Acidimicrobiales bacterium]